MKNKIFGRLCMVFVVMSVLLISGNTATAQEILLDKMEKCGDLICYPGMKETNQFYYLPDQPRLAYKDGKPQFSFLKYARTQETGKAGIGRAQGGGILHFLVTYGVSEGRVKAAEKQLQERHPDARIVGPIVYRKGNFALITSFKEGNELTTRTVAVGKAPLMEGQKAAVSMALTREGAELLWESFKSDTPDISLVFDMEFAGIREPYEATLEADWSRVSKHDRIKAGFKYAWFGADVDILFQELRQTGAIKITTKGTNTAMDNILQSANEKLLKVMFDPVAADDLTRAAAESGYDSLNQAAKLLKDAASSRSSSSGSSSGGSSSGRRSSGSSSSGSFRNIPGIIHDSSETTFWASLFNIVFPLAYADPTESVAQDQPAGEGSGTATTNPIINRAKEAFSRGSDHYTNGRYQEALEDFQEGLEILSNTDNPIPTIRAGFLFNIGVVLIKLERYEDALVPLNEAADIYGRDTKDGRDTVARIREADGLAASRNSGRSTTVGEQHPTESAPSESASDAYNRSRRLYEDARTGGFQASATRAALEAYEGYQRAHNPTGSRAEEVSGRIRMLRERLASSGATSTVASGESRSDLPNPFEETIDSPPPPASSGSTAASQPETTSTGSGGTSPSPGTASSSTVASANSRPSTGPSASTANPGRQTTAARQTRANGSPGISLVASYQMKRIKRSGKMVYNMNHFRTETQAFAMAENIGSIYKRYGNDSRMFRAVTIDDPVFKQREILVTLDGQDASTFTKYLNFVTVKMKKRHQVGEVTTGEIVITPESFNNSGNNFSMTYGWKDDANRTAWLNFEYQAIWSFHGGVEIRTPWTETDSPMLALTPPHRYRTVSIEGNGNSLTRAEVRHGVVTLSCRIGDHYITRQVTIRNDSTAPSIVLDIPEDPDNPETQVGITWYLTKSRKLSSAETKLEGDIIYWDELPKGGI